MGAEQSKGGNQVSKEDLLNQYELLEHIDNDIQVLRHKQTSELIGVREYNLTDESEFQRIYDSLSSKLSLTHPNLIKVLYVLKKKETQLCSTFYKVILVFEFIKNTLQQEIQNRQELQQKFTEDELWNILSQSILGISYLYQNNLSHSNIRSSTLLITDGGIVKVSEPQLLSQLTLYAETLTNRDHISQETYLSPELLAALFDQEYNPHYDQQRSDVFSLGMTVINAALLEPLDQAYDYKNCTIDEVYIIQKLLKVKSIYGSNLYNYLSAMVIMNVEDRQDLFVFDQIVNQQAVQRDSLALQNQQLPLQPNKLTTQLQTEPRQSSNYNETKQLNSQQSSQSKVIGQSDYKTYEKEQEAYRPPANPYLNAPKPQNSAGMFKDNGDNRSQIQYIPVDNKDNKNVIPDQSGGNAIGQSVETEKYQQVPPLQVQQKEINTYLSSAPLNGYVQPQQTYTSTSYTSSYNLPITQKYTPPVAATQTYTPPVTQTKTPSVTQTYTPSVTQTYTPPVTQTYTPSVNQTYTVPSYSSQFTTTQNPIVPSSVSPATQVYTPSVPTPQEKQNTQISSTYTSSSTANFNPSSASIYNAPVTSTQAPISIPAYTSTYTAPSTVTSANTYAISTQYPISVPSKSDYSIKNYGFEATQSASNSNETANKLKDITEKAAINTVALDAPKTNTYSYETKVTSNPADIKGITSQYVPYNPTVAASSSKLAATTATTTTSYSYQISNPLTPGATTYLNKTPGVTSDITTVNSLSNNANGTQNPVSSFNKDLPAALTSAGFSVISKTPPLSRTPSISNVSALTGLNTYQVSNPQTQQLPASSSTNSYLLNSSSVPISIEEAIKKSAPPPPKNYDDILPASSYTGTSSSYKAITPVTFANATATYQNPAAPISSINANTFTTTTTTAQINKPSAVSENTTNKVPQDAIEEILARYRNKTETAQTATTPATVTTDFKVNQYSTLSSNQTTIPASIAITSANVQASNTYSNYPAVNTDNKWTPSSYSFQPSAEAATKAPITSTYTPATSSLNYNINSIPAVTSAIQSGNNTYNMNNINNILNGNLEDEKTKKSSAINPTSTNTDYVNSYVNNYLDNTQKLTSLDGNQQQQQQQYQTSQATYSNNSAAAFGNPSNYQQQQEETQQQYYNDQYNNQEDQYEGQEQEQNDEDQYYNSDREYVVENYQNESKYEGEKLNGMRDGRGRFYYQDGGLFDGEWCQNKMHGKGVLSYASGQPAYDGDWIDDKFDGYGVLYNENPEPLDQPYNFTDFDYVDEFWTKYEGQFKEDNKQGFGTLYLSNGERFEGTFFQDFVNGQGVYYTLDGQQLEGVWNQNKLVQE